MEVQAEVRVGGLVDSVDSVAVSREEVEPVAGGSHKFFWQHFCAVHYKIISG